MENKVTIYKGEVMHDLKALFDNAGDYFEDEYELVKQYIEQLEQALDKATIAFPELLIKLMRIFKHFIEEYSEPEFEKSLKEIDPDKYIELGFNDFENA